jgi:hypothetical protein
LWKWKGKKEKETSCLIPESADAVTAILFPHTCTVISLFSLVNKIIREEEKVGDGVDGWNEEKRHQGAECGGTGSHAFPDPLVLRSFHARQRREGLV